MSKPLRTRAFLAAASAALLASPALSQTSPPARAAAAPPAATASDVPVTAAVSTPRDPKPPLPGFADGRGPTGPVGLAIVSPKPGEEIPVAGPQAKGSPVRLVFELKNYETFLDPATKSGQAIAIFLDGLPYFAHFDATKPWTFKNVPVGTHTLRAVPIRPWGEPIRDGGAYASVTFHVGQKDGKNVPAAGEPTLALLSPKPRAKYTAAQAAALPFNFVVSGCRVAEGDGQEVCRVRYKIGDQPEVIVAKEGAVTIASLAPGKYVLMAGLTREKRLIPGTFTLVQASFEVEGSAPAVAPAVSPVAPAPPAKAN